MGGGDGAFQNEKWVQSHIPFVGDFIYLINKVLRMQIYIYIYKPFIVCYSYLFCVYVCV